MNKYQTSHPLPGELLQYADGELTRRDAARIREHLEACWHCRTEMEGVRETITDYVRYERVLLDASPAAPASWNSFEGRLDRLIAERQTVRKRPRWILAAALAAAALVISFAALELRHPATVSAAELLQKAAQKEAATVQRPKRLRITRGSRGAGAELRPLFLEAHYSWDDPLSASSFRAWRDGLTDRRDVVSLHEGFYEIRTSTASSSLEDATLTLRAQDLSVERGTFHFRGSEVVEIAALPDAPAKLPPAPQTESAPVHRPAAPIEPSEELHVLAALHSAQVDLGEQVELSRDRDGRLVVAATGIPESRRAAVERALASLPDVVLHWQEPAFDMSKPAQTETGHDRTATPVAMGDALEASEAAMVQAHNLRKLAQRFPAATEQRFHSDDRAMLTGLRHDHADALTARVADLDRLLGPLLNGSDASPGEVPPAAPNWQAAAELLFSGAQRLDKQVTTLLTEANPPAATVADTARALQQLKADIDWYRRY